MMKSGEQLSEIVGPAYHNQGTHPEVYSGPKLLEEDVPGGNWGLASKGGQVVWWLRVQPRGETVR